MERRITMAFFQKGFFNPTNFKPPKIKQEGKKTKKTLIKSFKYLKLLKNKSGFANLLLLPFIALMVTGMLGMFVLSQGIKSKTVAQSHCLQTNLKSQKELGLILTQLLKLNKKSKKLHTKRLIVKASLMAALATGSFIIANQLRKKLKKIKQQQKLLMVKQKALLAKSRLVKVKAFKKLRQKLKTKHIKDITEKVFYKKALAVKKRKIGDKAYSYHPVPNFINHQKSRFIWKAKIPVTPLDAVFKKFLPYDFNFYGTYFCTASLKKRGTKWESTLYH